MGSLFYYRYTGEGKFSPTTGKFKALPKSYLSTRRHSVFRMLRGNLLRCGRATFPHRVIKGMFSWIKVNRELFTIKTKIYGVKTKGKGKKKKKEKKLNLVDLFLSVLLTLAPKVTFRFRKIAGLRYPIPYVFTSPHRDLFLAARWLVRGAKLRSPKNLLAVNLASEMQEAFTNKGSAIGYRNRVHAQALDARVNTRFL